ncbi:synaptonemal complex central element protein 1 isoform 2-T2 [Spinachia spinachia]
MIELEGLNIEDMIHVKLLNEGGETLESEVEHLMGKLRRLQHGKRVLEEGIKEIISVKDLLQNELTTLQTEAYKLEGIHKENEELCRKLQFQCEDSEQDVVRYLKQNKKIEELLDKYRCEIQELKLKHRKQRMKFENQLYQLIEQHKNLRSLFTPERLPEEIGRAENTKSQLQFAEQMKLAQLHRLNEKLFEMEKQISE